MVGCPVSWCSKFQTEICLSTTESEYIAFIQAMRNVIPFVALMKELSFIFDIHLPKPEVDNQSFISIVEYIKKSLTTKHITIK